jgi:TadE-like protein
MSIRLRPKESARGQGLVEFALVLPLLLLLMFAVFDAGRAVIQYSALTNAAREGARMAIVNQDEGLIEERVQDLAFTMEIANLGSIVSFVRESDRSTCTPLAVGCIAVVEPQADWTPITPIVGNIIGPMTFTARAEMPIEFVCPTSRIPAYATSAGCPKQP